MNAILLGVLCLRFYIFCSLNRIHFTCNPFSIFARLCTPCNNPTSCQQNQKPLTANLTFPPSEFLMQFKVSFPPIGQLIFSYIPYQFQTIREYISHWLNQSQIIVATGSASCSSWSGLWSEKSATISMGLRERERVEQWRRTEYKSLANYA